MDASCLSLGTTEDKAFLPFSRSLAVLWSVSLNSTLKNSPTKRAVFAKGSRKKNFSACGGIFILGRNVKWSSNNQSSWWGGQIHIMKDILLGFVGSKEVLDSARDGKHINPSGFTEISSSSFWLNPARSSCLSDAHRKPQMMLIGMNSSVVPGNWVGCLFYPDKFQASGLFSFHYSGYFWIFYLVFTVLKHCLSSLQGRLSYSFAKGSTFKKAANQVVWTVCYSLSLLVFALIIMCSTRGHKQWWDK